MIRDVVLISLQSKEMKTICINAFLILFFGCLIPVHATPVDTNTSNTGVFETASLCDRLIEYKKTDRFELLSSPEETRRFYTDRCEQEKNYAWFDSSLSPTAEAFELLRAIDDAYRHGLNPEKYHKTLLKHYLFTIVKKKFDSVEAKSRFIDHTEMFLSDAYFTLAHDLYEGFTDREAFKALNVDDEEIEWDFPQKGALDFGKILTEALGKNTVADSLKTLVPEFLEYGRLLKALALYRKLAEYGENESLPEGPTIREGDNDPRLPLITQRLIFLGDLDESDRAETTLYNDPALLRAVKSFQSRHNLKADGRIGENTLKALNVPIRERITQLILSLERYRWLNRGMENKNAYISINIPSFTLQLLEQGEEKFSMKVIVGKKERPTPILNSKIAYAVLNPTWTAPETIVREDILGKKNVLKYLKNHDMRVFQMIDGSLSELNPYTIDWEHYKTLGKAPFVFRANAGDENPLGEIKFIFPNRYSVYMHDTNTPALFQNDYRALSSGCIRLSDPSLLLTYLSPKDDIISSGNRDNRKIELRKKLPVILRYMTAAADAEGKVYFYEDIYGYDRLHLQILKPIDIPIEQKE